MKNDERNLISLLSSISEGVGILFPTEGAGSGGATISKPVDFDILRW